MPAMNETTPHGTPPAASDWPAADLESARRCEVCGSDHRAPWLEGLTDRIFQAAPGRWTLWRCTSCGAAQLDPRPTPGSIGRAYRAYYTHQGIPKNFLVPGDRPDLRIKRALHLSFYNHRYGHRLAGALPLGWLAIAASRARRARAGQYIRHLPGVGGGASLLDVGCGDGGFLRVARALGYHARGLEFDPAAAALAQAQDFDVAVGSVDDAQVEDASLDQITLNHVIEHLHHPVEALQRLRRWLRPGGRVWIQTPNVDGAGAKRFGADWRGLEPPRHLVMFGPRSLRFALERAGFERIELLPPQLDAQFYLSQSIAIRAGRDPYKPTRDQRRAARREGRAWDRAALAAPERAESITMVGYRPG